MKLILGDTLTQLKKLSNNSVDAIVTDPPYGYSFMGRKWDYDVPGVDVWKECLRVLKPGGHLLSFSGTRTHHRITVNIEDAGFEIRDTIMWVYGSGFPKSHNIGKAVDKLQGNEREAVGEKIRGDVQKAKETGSTFAAATANKNNNAIFGYGVEVLTKGTSEWEGWGTALKPALEPITVARKPVEGTVAQNVLKHRTGGLNIDGCRVDSKGETTKGSGNPSANSIYSQVASSKGNGGNTNTQGRFPANLIHDGSDEVVGLFPDSKSTGGSGEKSMGALGKSKYGKYALDRHGANAGGLGDSGSAARFFYCAKASKQDRDEGLELAENQVLARSCQAQAEAKRGNTVEKEGGAYNKARIVKNNHPTVKPTDLMRYLCRLVTPPSGVVLDPYIGSGSTGKAAVLEGFSIIGIDDTPEYIEIAKARIKHAKKTKKQVGNQLKLSF